MLHSGCPVAERTVSRVLIIDDHPLYSDALAAALEQVFADCTLRKASTLAGAFAALDDGFRPDLVMLDLKLPDVSDISGFRALRARLPEVLILVISALASVDLAQSLLREGAAGFLPKDAPATALRHALDEITAGRRYVPAGYQQVAEDPAAPDCSYDADPCLAALTPQQRRIMKLICVGKPNKQIAFELSLAEATVKAHITALLRRLGVHNRTQAVVLVEGMLARQAGTEPEARAFLNG